MADRASPSILNPEFAPWMASTGSTPPSKRQGAMETEVSDTTDSGDSPGRPRSGSPTVKGKPPRSPTKRGKITKRMRKSPDKSYKQPSIRGFLTPSPPKSPPPSPVGGRTPLPTRRNKRRSQRMEGDNVIWRASKRINVGGNSSDSLEDFPRDIEKVLLDETMEIDDLPRAPASAQDFNIEEIIIDDPPAKVSTSEEPTIGNDPITVDLSNDFTPETIEAARVHLPEDPDTSNETAKKGGGYSHTPSPANSVSTAQDPRLMYPTPPSSQLTSSSSSTAAHRGRSESKDLSPTPGPSTGPTVHSNLSAKKKVTFHTNMDLATNMRPKHVLIKSHDDKLCVKILTFEAYNIDDIVRCFFEEQYETDDPGRSFDETFQQLVDSSADNSPDASVISTIETYENTTVQTFVKTETTQHDDDQRGDISVICIDDSQEQVDEGQQTEEEMADGEQHDDEQADEGNIEKEGDREEEDKDEEEGDKEDGQEGKEKEDCAN